MSFLRPPVLVLLATLPLVAPIPGSGQSLGGSVSLGESPFHPLDRPLGFSLEAVVPLPGSLFLRGQLRDLRQDRTREGTTCTTWWPLFEECRQEPIRRTHALRSTQVGLGWEILGRGSAGVAVGALLGTHRVDGEAAGQETGRGDGTLLPEDRATALGFFLEARWSPPSHPWIQVVPHLQTERLDFGECLMDVGSFYCSPGRLTTVGVGVRLGRSRLTGRPR